MTRAQNPADAGPLPRRPRLPDDAAGSRTRCRDRTVPVTSPSGCRRYRRDRSPAWCPSASSRRRPDNVAHRRGWLSPTGFRRETAPRSSCCRARQDCEAREDRPPAGTRLAQRRSETPWRRTAPRHKPWYDACGPVLPLPHFPAPSRWSSAREVRAARPRHLRPSAAARCRMRRSKRPWFAFCRASR